jgi:hypothetical protein
MCRSSLAAFSLVLLLAMSGTARAQSAAAEVLFRDGDRLFAAGDIAAACDAFEASNRIESRAGTLVRLGHCRERNRQLASAWSAYSDALARAKDARKRRIARKQLDQLEPRLSQLVIRVPTERQVTGLRVTRNGVAVDPGLWNRSVPVDGGRYVIEARAPGHVTWSTTVVVAVEKARASVEVPRLPAAAVATRAEGDASGARRAATGARRAANGAEPLRDVPRTLGTRRGIALGLGVGAVAAGAGGLAFGLSSRNLSREAHARCPDMMCADHAAANDLMARSRRHVRYANVAFGTAGVFAIGAAALWLTGGDDDGRGVSVVPVLGPDQAGAAAVGRF